MPINVQDIYLTTGTELRMVAPSNGTARVEWFGSGVPPQIVGTSRSGRHPRSKRSNQLRKAVRRTATGKPSYRERQSAARAAKAKSLVAA